MLSCEMQSAQHKFYMDVFETFFEMIVLHTATSAAAQKQSHLQIWSMYPGKTILKLEMTCHSTFLGT